MSSSRGRRAGWISPSLYAALGLALAVTGTGPRVAMAQTVHGQVVDSVMGHPLPGATVTLLDAAESQVNLGLTDSSGLFLFRVQMAGTYKIRVAFPGYQTSTFPAFQIGLQQTRSYMLLLPSPTASQQYEALLADACPTNRDRGTIVGWVRHDDTRVPIGDATVNVSWASVPAFISETVSIGEFSGEARADSTGFFTICGAPMRTRIWLHAVGDSGLSDFLNLTFEQGGVTVGRSTYEAEDNVWRQDLRVVAADQRSTAIRGAVTAALTGEAVAGATVEILGTAFSTETDSAGGFELTGLPGGLARVVVRKIGNEQLQQEVLLPNEGVLELPLGTLILGAAQVLDPVVVETTPGHNPLAEFGTRRIRGVGSFITREEFMRQGSPATAVDVLRRMQGVRILSGGDLDNRWIISMQRGGPRTFGFGSNGSQGSSGDVGATISDVNPCPPLIFLDRHYIGNVNEIDVDGAIPLANVDAVEAHQSSASLPNQFSRPGSSCGVIAFWTRFAEPRSMEVRDRPRASRSLLETTGFHVFTAMAAIVGIFFALGKAIHF